MSKFKGVAFWTIATQKQDWIDLAGSVLEPMRAESLASVSIQQIATGGNELGVAFGGDNHRVTILNGEGRGLVRESASAGAFVVCLLAIRKTVGDIDIVDDNQEVIPTRPRQSNQLFSEDWDRVSRLARVLGLLPNQQFVTSYGALLNRMF